MKKQHHVFFGFAVLLIAALFTMTACGEDPGGRNVAANVRAYNNNGTAPARSRAMINARAAMNRAPRAAHPSFSEHTAFYSKLGALKTAITPSKFNLATSISLIDSTGWEYSLGKEFVNFAEGITVNIGEIPADITIAGMSFAFNTSGGLIFDNGSGGFSSVEFEWPGGKSAFDGHEKKWLYGMTINPIPPIGGFTPEWNGNKGTLFLAGFMPFHAENGINDPKTFKQFDYIYYGAGDRELMKTSFPMSRIIPGGAEDNMLGAPNTESLIVPFTPINIPASASSVTLHISWNLKDLISQYEGKTASPNDDIFVVKENWWDGLYLYASVQ